MRSRSRAQFRVQPVLRANTPPELARLCAAVVRLGPLVLPPLIFAFVVIKESMRGNLDRYLAIGAGRRDGL